MMRQASEQALERMLRSWEGVVAHQPSEAIRWADEFFAVSDVLTGSSALVRAITDPARSGDARAELARSVLSGKVSGEVTDYVAGLSRERVSAAKDIIEAITLTGVETLLMSAQYQNRLDAVEEELYRASQVLGTERTLRRSLEERGSGLGRRHELAGRIFGGWTPETVALIKHAVSTDSSIIPQLRHWVSDAGRRSEHLVAIVTAAQPLESDQEARLTALLSQRYGKPVEIHVGVDPEIIGGLRIVIGADVIDGSLASRINNVKSVFTD
ncbi:F0F1 ATP synthase subunit delta [Flaviflexus equikiangi]|uniref:ATP synthase subunit delta n=1 Tax=Flaviflexus equikiangi TaxID=2758573 RepID=A0ABS2TFR8_9ACTO|nr:F0F1 ATP synthase subunit delta [Flaviflexus equikiangi]MBM9433482.1 F0F1 ATP synthase subunit delta [Flaviflexus equikiangi]